MYDQVMAIGSTTAGLLADGLVKSGMSVTRVRKLVQTIAFMVPAGATDLPSVHAMLTTWQQLSELAASISDWGQYWACTPMPEVGPLVRVED